MKVVIGILVATLAVLALWALPPELVDVSGGQDLTGKDRADAIANERRTVLAALAGLAAAVGLVYTALKHQLDRDSNVTERYTRAVEQLGHDSLAIRLGGLYSLDRIAGDSERDRDTIYQVMSAFIRNQTKTAPANPPDTDVAAALTLLTRKASWVTADTVRANLNLQGAFLVGADLAFTRLFGANLWTTDLTAASLLSADLQLALLVDANLTDANLIEANLLGAKLHRADLTRADLTRADLTNADLTRADLTNANLTAADLTNANLIGANLTNADLTRANLTDSNLAAADLTNANLTNATLTNATLTSADLTGAHLAGVTGLDSVTGWESVTGLDSVTGLPPDFPPPRT